MTLIYVGGVPGVGKTSLITETEKLLTEDNLDFSVYCMGDLMFDIAYDKGLVKVRDELSYLDRKTRNWLRDEAVDFVASEKSSDKDIILDAHYCIRTEYGFEPAMTEENLDILKPESYVLVAADPEDIYERRQNDPTRDRGDYSLEEIQLELILEEGEALYFSQYSGAEMKTILMSGD